MRAAAVAAARQLAPVGFCRLQRSVSRQTAGLASVASRWRRCGSLRAIAAGAVVAAAGADGGAAAEAPDQPRPDVAASGADGGAAAEAPDQPRIDWKVGVALAGASFEAYGGLEQPGLPDVHANGTRISFLDRRACPMHCLALHAAAALHPLPLHVLPQPSTPSAGSLCASAWRACCRSRSAPPATCLRRTSRPGPRTTSPPAATRTWRCAWATAATPPPQNSSAWTPSGTSTAPCMSGGPAGEGVCMQGTCPGSHCPLQQRSD